MRIMKLTLETKEAIKELASRNITTEQFQKIISALRGPDAIEGKDGERETHALKQLTTARIRAIVVPGYYGDVRVAKLSPMEMKLRDVMLEYAPQHFQSHYREAVKAIKQIFNYDLIKEQPYDRESKGHSSVDDSDGSGIRTHCGKASCGLCNLQPGEAVEAELIKSVLVPKAI